MSEKKEEGKEVLNIDTQNLAFQDVSDEEFRVYVFPEIAIRIDRPRKLNVNPKSGGHRIYDESGLSHYIPAGWKHLFWQVKPGHNPFAF